ncbi:hypothetical protein G4V62_02965 [Bacillaceae bacterium SIJ1]|uniref:S-layer homology domain-containing protein n=1 Tax=Litoribacterium kuwaitense TaxID=1398745 RepID=UPI0013EC8AFC|nr:S-layer homology domain-containing protein [Litoribacterium kuwaitense]NGP43960.1 hypothetical protein [Litoribacterium kuwaitense]
MAYQPKSFRKFLATATTATVAAGAIGAAAPAVANAQDVSFSDVPADAWFAEAVYSLAAEGVIEGVGNGIYAPDESMTRAQIATLYANYLDLDTENVTAPGFSDVDADSWYYGAVAAAVDAGLFEGYPNGTFQPNESINRAELAEVISRSFGVEATSTNTPFTDLEGYGWAEDSIAALVEAGIVEGRTATTYVPGADVTRAEAAAFLYKSVQAGYGELVDLVEVESVESTNSTTTTVTLPEAFEGEEGEELSAKNFEVLVDGEEVEVELSEVSEDGLTVTLTHESLDGKEGTLTVNDVEAEFNYAETVIDSVEAINLGQVEVTFSNSEFDKVQASNPENYSFEDEDGDDLEDQDDDEVEVVDVVIDGNKALLTLGNKDDNSIIKGVENQTDGKVIVDKNVLGEEETFDVEYSDSTIPEVTDVQVIGEDAVKVFFSEPMDVSDLDARDSDWDDIFTVEEDGDEKNIREVKVGTRNDVAVIELSGANFSNGDTVTVDVDNEVEDLAGFNVSPERVDVEVEENDEEIEIVGFRNASQTGITLVFNKDLSSDNLDADDFYHTNTSNRADTADVINGNEVKLTFKSEDALPEGSAKLYVASGTLEDYWGNDQDKTLEYTVEVGEDNSAPEIEDIDYDNKEITVEFNKELDEDSAEDEDNYKITDEDGDEINVDIEDIKLIDIDDENDNGVVITLEDELPSGTYDLEVSDLEDTFGNAIDTLTDDFDVDADDDFDAQEVLENTLAFETGNDEELEFIVDFGRKMVTGDDRYSIENLENYKVEVKYDGDENIDNGEYTLGALDEEDEFDVSVTASDNGYAAKVTIEADEPEDYKALLFDSEDRDSLTLSFDNLEDDYGNRSNETDQDEIKVLEKDEKSNQVTIVDAVKTDDDKVKLTLNKAVDTVDENDIRVGGHDVDKAKLLSGGTIVELTLEDDISVGDKITAEPEAFETPFGLTSVEYGDKGEEFSVGEERDGDVIDETNTNFANRDMNYVAADGTDLGYFEFNLVFTDDVEFIGADLADSGEFTLTGSDGEEIEYSTQEAEGTYQFVDNNDDDIMTIKVFPEFGEGNQSGETNVDEYVDVDFDGDTDALEYADGTNVEDFNYRVSTKSLNFDALATDNAPAVDTVELAADGKSATIDFGSETADVKNFEADAYTVNILDHKGQTVSEDVDATVKVASNGATATVTLGEDVGLKDGQKLEVTNTNDDTSAQSEELVVIPELGETLDEFGSNTFKANVTNEINNLTAEEFKIVVETEAGEPVEGVEITDVSINSLGNVVFTVTEGKLENGQKVTVSVVDGETSATGEVSGLEPAPAPEASASNVSISGNTATEATITADLTVEGDVTKEDIQNATEVVVTSAANGQVPTSVDNVTVNDDLSSITIKVTADNGLDADDLTAEVTINL